MKHVKLFEQFINEANSTMTFVEKYNKAKTIQPKELTNINAFGVIQSRLIMGNDEKTHAVGTGKHSFLRETDVVEITGIEILEFDKEVYEKIGVLKKFWKSIEKQGGLIQINLADRKSVVTHIISTPEWFENYATIK